MAVRRYELTWMDGTRASVTLRFDAGQATIIAMDGPVDRLFGLPRGLTKEAAIVEELRFLATRDDAQLGVVDVVP